MSGAAPWSETSQSESAVRQAGAGVHPGSSPSGGAQGARGASSAPRGASTANPDPSAWVRFGEQTFEEMMIGYVNWIPAEGR